MNTSAAVRAWEVLPVMQNSWRELFRRATVPNPLVLIVVKWDILKRTAIKGNRKEVMKRANNRPGLCRRDDVGKEDTGLMSADQ